MNTTYFLLPFLMGLGGSVIINYRKLSSASMAHKVIIYIVIGLSLGMAMIYWLNLILPFPPRWIAEHIAPMMEKMLKE